MKTEHKPKRARRARGGALFLISALMLGSAVLRLGVEAGPAISKEVMEQQPKMPAQDVSQGSPSSVEMQQLLDSLRDRERALNEREIQIEDQMKVLDLANATIEDRLSDLIQAEESLAATLALANGASEDDLARLTSVYEKMKPKEAAALFEEMAPEFAAGFLGRMRPDAAAGVMAKLSPAAAYTISVILAGRNATVPKS